MSLLGAEKRTDSISPVAATHWPTHQMNSSLHCAAETESKTPAALQDLPCITICNFSRLPFMDFKERIAIQISPVPTDKNNKLL